MRIKQKNHAFVSSIWKFHSKYSRNGSDSAVSMDAYNCEFKKILHELSMQCTIYQLYVSHYFYEMETGVKSERKF